MPAKPMHGKKTYTQRLFKRFSEITGVPVKQLIPVKKRKIHEMEAGYYPTTHRYSKGLTEKSEVLNDLIGRFVEEHEVRHGLQILSNNGTLFQHVKSNKAHYALQRKWLEATNADPEAYRILEALLNMGYTKTTSLIGSMAHAYTQPFLLAVSAYLLPQYIAQIKRQSNVRSLIKKHGEDSMLLLWAAPPKKLDALQVPKWEKEMIQEGYLHENSGMTKKGLQYFRKHIQPATIWQRLAEFKKERKKSKNKEK